MPTVACRKCVAMGSWANSPISNRARDSDTPAAPCSKRPSVPCRAAIRWWPTTAPHSMRPFRRFGLPCPECCIECARRRLERMARWSIGDVQGCADELAELIERIGFRSDRDQLWFVGDLVNRGPESLKVLRLVRSLGDSALSVLGNHDLHLLAVALVGEKLRKSDTLTGILDAPDRDALIEWLPDKRVEGGEVLAGPPFQDDIEMACGHSPSSALT